MCSRKIVWNGITFEEKVYNKQYQVTWFDTFQIFRITYDALRLAWYFDQKISTRRDAMRQIKLI